MPEISAAQIQRMKSSYRAEIARFIAEKAGKLTYGDIAAEFGGIERGYGSVLGGITIFCRERGLPLLPVLVVSKRTGRPSEGAKLYLDFGLREPEDFDEEQRRCLAQDWSKVEF